MATIGLMLIAPAWAARPLSTDDAGILDKGAWEVESGYEWDQPLGGGASSGGLAVAAKYGLLPNLDLAAEIPYALTGTTGLGDATVKGKLAINEQFSVRADVKLANADSTSGLGTGYIDYGLTAILSRSMGDVTVHGNLGYTIVGQAGGAASNTNSIYYGVAFEKPLNEKSNLMGDLFGEYTQAAGSSLEVLLGANLAMNDTVTLDGGIDLGLNNNASQYKVAAGVTLAL